jgi:hypothetical protein
MFGLSVSDDTIYRALTHVSAALNERQAHRFIAAQ